MKKICKKCLKEKDLNDFYVHKAMADGHLGFCKECVKTRVHSRYFVDIEKSRENEKQRYERRKKDPTYIANVKRIGSEWRKNNRARSREMSRLYFERHNLPHNIRRKLKNQIPDNCEICKISKDKIYALHGHHKDYSKPLDVVWVCPSCHSGIHHGRIPFQEII